ncbi:MAG: phage tail protein [Bacteroidia bacterium]
MATFGLIAEGITDQIVIENILYGYFSNKDLEITELQPKRDAADDNLASTHGNWDQVFKYCESDDFKGAFLNKELYAVIHLDTDVFASGNVSKAYQLHLKHADGKNFTVQETVDAVKDKLIECIGGEFYNKHQERIIFAIAVGEIECWLLPLYFTDKKKAKTVNCLQTLNQELSKGKKGFTIDAKKPDYYRTVSKPYQKQKTLKSKGPQNPSLGMLLNNLDERGIEIPEPDWDF